MKKYHNISGFPLVEVNLLLLNHKWACMLRSGSSVSLHLVRVIHIVSMFDIALKLAKRGTCTISICLIVWD